MKKKNIVVGVIMAAAVGFCAYSAYLKPDLLNFLPRFSGKQAMTDTNGNPAAASPQTGSGNGQDTDTAGIAPKKLYTMGDSVPFNVPSEAAKGSSLTGIVNYSKVSKQKPDYLDDSHFEYWNDETADANGTLTCPYSYVTINITLKFKSEKKCEVYIGPRICPITQSNEIGECIPQSELRYYDKGPRNNDKNYYYVMFSPDQEVTYNMLYILKDETLKNRLALGADCSGSNNFKNINFIELQF